MATIVDSAHEHHHAHHHAQDAAHHPRSILDREADARFYAQSGVGVGHKLDPHDPTDAKMIPLWLDIYAKVKAEDDAGKLVLTYNNPVVAQHLADAHVADMAAAVHLGAAAGASPHEAPQHVAAASTAAKISAHKTAEAAKLQPPTISPELAHEAAHEAAHEHPSRVPPTAKSQLAREQAKGAGVRAERVHHHHHHVRRGRPVKSTMPPHRVGEYRAHAAQVAHAAGQPFVLVVQHPDGSMDHQAFASRAELDAAYAQLSEHHDQYKYAGAFDLATSPSVPVHDSVGVPAAEHVEEPAPGEGAEGTPSDAGGAPEKPKSKWSVGTIAAIAVGVAAAGGLVYAGTRKSKTSSSGTRGRSRSPKVLVTSPPTPTRALRV